MDDATLGAKMIELKKELNAELGLVKSGGRAQNPGRISELKRTFARVLTIIHERKLGIKRNIRERRRKGSAKAVPAAQAASAPKKEKPTVKAENKE